jgi:hypothetical protein
MGTRAIDGGEWMKMSQAMIDASKVVLASVEAKDVDAYLEAGAGLNDTCDACHTQYQQ